MSEKQVEVNIYPNPKLFVKFAVREMTKQNDEGKRLIYALQIYEALQEMINHSDIEESEDGKSIVL